MAEVKDIMCEETGELACVGGDLVIGGSTVQHQADLLSMCEGEAKQWPTAGVGITGFLNDEDPLAMIRKIRMQLQQDGMSVRSVKYDGVVMIDAAYK